MKINCMVFRGGIAYAQAFRGGGIYHIGDFPRERFNGGGGYLPWYNSALARFYIRCTSTGIPSGGERAHVFMTIS